MNQLENRHIVVVGGTQGMGLGVAKVAARAGARITIGGRTSERAQSVAAEHGLGWEGKGIDVTDVDSIDAFFTDVGAFDHLVLTASPGKSGAFRTTPLEEAKTYFDGKLFGTYAVAWYAVRTIEPRGSMIFLTGGLAVRPTSGRSQVTAAFGGVEALTRALAVELAPIRVNALRPGFVDTPLWSFLSTAEVDAMRERARSKLPARHVGTGEDIGHAALFAMTNPYVTGTVIPVDGGGTLI